MNIPYPWVGVQEFCLLTPDGVKDLHPYLHGVGSVMDNVVGVVNCHPCKLSLKYSIIKGKWSGVVRHIY